MPEVRVTTFCACRRIFVSTFILCLCGVSAVDSWWNLGAVNFEVSEAHANFKNSFNCLQFPGFSVGQMRLCQRYFDHMPILSKAVRMGLEECQKQFRNRRWNCTLGNSTSMFGFLSQSGTPELSFVNAIMAASAVHSVARACRNSELSTCGCSDKRRPLSLPKDWLWQGCGDNNGWGYTFAFQFVDARERDQNFPRKSKELARTLTNLHNNEAGRRAVHAYSKPFCKCHGVSGACNLKTCWNHLPSIWETGDRLRQRYDNAAEVRFNRQGTKLVQRHRRFNRPTKEDLIYTDSPPDYCNSDLTTGSLGTVGRTCNQTSSGTEGCSLMCCDRGYQSRRIFITEQCHCKFHWCCFVKCKTCEFEVNMHRCK